MRLCVSKEVWIGWVSSMVEAYNMAIYSFVAPVLAKLLFQETSALFFSYILVFVAACLFYPVGAIYYGLIGDKQGRRRTCIYSTLGLALSTGLMGFVPIAGNAWIFFLIFICAQHFFSGGEYHGSIVFSLEHGKQKPGLMSALSCLFAVFGLVAANGFASFALENLFWIRICFIIGGVGGLISYFLKNHCHETPAFMEQKSLSLGSIKSEWRQMGVVIVILAFFIVSYNFIFIFLPLMQFEQTDTFTTFTSLIAYGILLVGSGILADRFGVEKVMLTGLGLFALVLLPLGYFSTSLGVFQMVLTPCACLVIGPIHGWMLEQFPVRMRCRGIFISSGLATSIFGGSTVPLCLLIYENFHSLSVCCIYPLLIALSGFIYLWRFQHEVFPAPLAAKSAHLS